MSPDPDIPRLIQTKLHKPPLPVDLVPRSRLLERLNWNPERPLTLVLAPAGYGKSTMVSAWLQTTDRLSAWLSLDEHDSALPDFLSYFIGAIRTVIPHACQQTLELLHAPEIPQLRVVAAVLINDLAAIEQPFILVLDDYQAIRNIVVHDLLDQLVSQQPRALHLVLISRFSPPLDLNKVRARGWLVEIRLEDLRFDTREAAMFLQQATGLLIAEADADQLDRKCEGWVTALRLTSLSMRNKDDFARILAELRGDSAHVRDYLASEVLARLPQGVQGFLVRTSILDRLSGSLCDAVMELDEPECHGQAYLEWLHSANLFIIPLDTQRRWYRYHHLFQDLLRSRLKRELDTDCIAQLHSRASAWFARNGLTDEALQHALAAQDISAAARLVEDSVRTLLDEDQWHTLEVRMARLPEEVIEQRPVLLLAKAWVAFNRFALWAIPPILETIENTLEDNARTRPLWGEVDFFWGHHWYWHGQTARSLELLGRALERIPKTHHLARGQAELFWGLASQMAGQKKEALRGLQRWLYYEEASHPGRQTKLLGSLIFIRLLAGELPDADVVVQQARDLAAQHENSYVLAWTSYLQGYIHYFWHDLEKAAQSFALATEKLYVMYVGAAVDSLAGLALTYQALGQPDHANATIERLLDFAQEIHDPAYMTVARSCQARLAVLRGDTRSATRWLRTADLTTDAAGTLFYWLEVPRLTQCRVLIAQGTPVSLQDAIEKLQSYRLLSEATHNTCQMIQILALEALARQKQGQTDDALDLLEQAAILAEPGGWIHPFVELGPEAASLLSQLGRQGTTPHFIAQILATFPVQSLGQPAASHPPLPEPLTDREIEVLALLAQRHSNKEIAADLVISTTTVKRHASNIYQKLQVGSRRQAVAKAIALGILPPSN